MDAITFLKTFAEALKNNPPHATDHAIVESIKKLGIEAGKDFNVSQLNAEQIKIVEQAKIVALEKIKNEINKQKNLVNGWLIKRKNIGNYGNNYLSRAVVAYYGLGANIPQDAIYPSAEVDENGHSLTGKNQYILHFTKNNLPPVKAFWSLTLYGPDGFFVQNPLHRYSLGDRDKLKYNSDGSLDIYIQNQSPGTSKERNWLPAPEGKFNLLLRLYWPLPSVLNGQWKPPAI